MHISHLWLIGIGTGSHAHLTLEGQAALREAAIVLLPQKAGDKEDLAQIRRDILHAVGATARVIAFDMPVRDETLDYQTRVARWHDEIAEVWQAAVAPEDVDGPVALLVWGDPSLYDTTLRIAERLSPRPHIRVVPGITALQALTAGHAIPLNSIDGTITVTTGQRLRKEGWPKAAETVCVMLDGACSFTALRGEGLHIWWGGFLGMPQEVLRSGPLDAVADDIVACRAEARAAHGWIMDTYLLRRMPL